MRVSRYADGRLCLIFSYRQYSAQGIYQLEKCRTKFFLLLDHNFYIFSFFFYVSISLRLYFLYISYCTSGSQCTVLSIRKISDYTDTLIKKNVRLYVFHLKKDVPWLYWLYMVRFRINIVNEEMPNKARRQQF